MLLSSFIFFVSPLTACMHAIESHLIIFEFGPFSVSFGSEYCQRAAGLLVCQSYFPLCDCESGHLYLASRQECERISMVECKEEWTSAKQYGIPLPNCTDLPDGVTGKKPDFTHKPTYRQNS